MREAFWPATPLKRPVCRPCVLAGRATQKRKACWLLTHASLRGAKRRGSPAPPSRRCCFSGLLRFARNDEACVRRFGRSRNAKAQGLLAHYPASLRGAKRRGNPAPPSRRCCFSGLLRFARNDEVCVSSHLLRLKQKRQPRLPLIVS